MTNDDFANLMALRHEVRGVEFKGPGSRSNRRLFVRVVKAMLGMANRRDGGIVIIGVNDSDSLLEPVGLKADELSSWRYDDVAAGIATYADPFVGFEMRCMVNEGKNYVVIEVEEFEEIPVLCKKDYQDILRDGGCYVRSRRKPETSEIPTHTDMRDLLELATEKAVRKYIAQAQRTGLIAPSSFQPDDSEQFDNQLGELL